MLLNLACSTDSSDDEAADRPADLTEEEFRAELVNAYPPTPLLNAMGFDTQGSGPVLRVTQLLQSEVSACMRQRGWDYDTQLREDEVGVVWLPAMSREEFASTHGYGSRLDPSVTSNGLVIGGDDIDEYYWEVLSPSEREEYSKDLDGESGCREHALDAFSASLQPMEAVFDQVAELLEANSDYRAATATYLECMADQGITWQTDPQQAQTWGHEHSERTNPSLSDEIDAALSDLECRYPWEVVARRVRHEVEASLIEPNRELLVQLKELLSG